MNLHRLTERVWCVEHLGVADAPCPVDPVPVCDGDDGHPSEPCRYVPLYTPTPALPTTKGNAP